MLWQCAVWEVNEGAGELSAMTASTMEVAASLKELLGQRQQTAPSAVAELGAAVQANGQAVANSLQEILGKKKDVVHVCLETALSDAGLDTFFPSRAWPPAAAVRRVTF